MRMTESARDQNKNLPDQVEDEWKGLAPSDEPLAAARSLKGCKNVLVYGGGWAGVVIAKSGCPCVTRADPAPDAEAPAESPAERSGAAGRIHTAPVSGAWLTEVPDGTCDGLYCSDALDAAPPEAAEDLLARFARIVTKDARVIIESRDPARADGEWQTLLERHFDVVRLERFARPGEKEETGRLFFLRPQRRKPEEIVTERLRLSALRPGDRVALLEILMDGEVSRTYMVPDLPTEDKKTALFERLRALSENPRRFVYGIFLGEALIGMIHDVSMKEDEIELGYFVSPAHKNRGYASEALAACLPALSAMGYALVKAGAFAENRASLRVMEKCGLKRTGERETIEYRGKSHLCVYCAVRPEPSAQNG